MLYTLTGICLCGCNNHTANESPQQPQTKISTTENSPLQRQHIPILKKNSEKAVSEKAASTRTSTEKNNQPSASQKNPNLIIADCTTAFSAEEKKHTQTKKTVSLLINGEKFTTADSPLLNGSALHNLTVNQQGYVAGNLIMVAEDLDWPLQGDNYSLNIIKQHTYRLIPKSLKVDFYCLYQAVNKLKNVERTELSIDYRPHKKSSF